MHTLFVMNERDYKSNVEGLVAYTANNNEKSCYISFNDPYNIVIDTIDSVNADDQFVVIDASRGNVKRFQTVNRNTYVVPVRDLFNVYMFLRGLIIDEGIKHILVDSLSALIVKNSQLPLKEMMTDLLLEVGARNCGSSLVVYDHHQNHEVVQHLAPLIGKNVVI